MGSLATAWHLTAEPGWQDRYEITVYQLGWRAGGKGASSRQTPELGGRIEEHGLHVWFGCYDNAFSMLRGCYDELGRPPGTPFATMDEAFEPHDATPYFEEVAGRWTTWPVWFPPNPSRPGIGGPLPTTWDYLVMLVEGLARAVGRLPDDAGRPLPAMPEALARRLPASVRNGPETILHGLVRLARALPSDPARQSPRQLAAFVKTIDRAKRRLARRLAPRLATSDRLRRSFIEIDLGLTLVRGLVADGVLRHGFDVIDDEDVRAWFTRHGALPMTVRSTPVRALYDLYFAYEGGDVRRPSFAAGVAVGAVLRLALAYKGSVVYEMQAGMGEVVIAPAYEALRKRGVRFAFFHRVTALELAPDGRSIARVRMARQVDLLDGTLDGYDPLVEVDGLPCWPPAPKAELIKHGDRLAGHDLESRWSGWTDAGETVLEAGTGFDQVVLGISLAGIAELTPELSERSGAWRAMTTRIGTTQTMSAQLWMDHSLAELGWKGAAVPTDAAPESLDVWADRTETLRFEGWGQGGPRSVQYLCGPMPGDLAGRPPTDTGIPDEARSLVAHTTERWLATKGVLIWPSAVSPEGDFDWSMLHDGSGDAGPDRLGAQFLRANIDPSERYVLSLPGTTRHRMTADGSGFGNLVLTGDWTRTTWNVGCIEAAAESGRNAARAVARRSGQAR